MYTSVYEFLEMINKKYFAHLVMLPIEKVLKIS